MYIQTLAKVIPLFVKSQNESSQAKPKILNFAANGAIYL